MCGEQDGAQPRVERRHCDSGNRVKPGPEVVSRAMQQQSLIARELGAEEVLSQYGYRGDDPPFRNRPREWSERSEPGMSTIVGKLTPAEAMSFVRARQICIGHDGVRHTTVGKLRDAGFVVSHTPNPRNPGHVTVSRAEKWGEDTVRMFDSCFDEPIYADGGHDE
jgi:hypothetical protein